MKFTCGTAAPAHLSEASTLKLFFSRRLRLQRVHWPCRRVPCIECQCGTRGPETSALSPQCYKRNWRKVNAIYERNIEYSIVRIITDLPLCHEICEPLLSRVKQRKSLLFPCLIAEIGMSVNPEVAIYMFSSSLVSSGVFLV